MIIFAPHPSSWLVRILPPVIIRVKNQRKSGSLFRGRGCGCDWVVPIPSIIVCQGRLDQFYLVSFLNNLGQDFLDIQYCMFIVYCLYIYIYTLCPRSLNPFYILSKYKDKFELGQDFLGRQYSSESQILSILYVQEVLTHFSIVN